MARTSKSHPLEIAAVRASPTHGRIGITFCPGKHDRESRWIASGMTTHVNKVHHVTTITQVAKDLGEDEDWLRDVANEIAIEDGVIWAYGISEDGVQVHRLSI